MNCKKYRACLVGVIVVALVMGMFFYMKSVKESDAPAEGTLVKNCVDVGDETSLWA